MCGNVFFLNKDETLTRKLVVWCFISSKTTSRADCFSVGLRCDASADALNDKAVNNSDDKTGWRQDLKHLDLFAHHKSVFGLKIIFKNKLVQRRAFKNQLIYFVDNCGNLTRS